MAQDSAHRRITGRLVIATHNPGKLVEMRDLLSVYGVEAVSAAYVRANASSAAFEIE